MQELSLVMGIIDLASMEAKAHGDRDAEEILLDIGQWGGVEMESFDFAWTGVGSKAPYLKELKEK